MHVGRTPANGGAGGGLYRNGGHLGCEGKSGTATDAGDCMPAGRLVRSVGVKRGGGRGRGNGGDGGVRNVGGGGVDVEEGRGGLGLGGGEFEGGNLGNGSKGAGGEEEKPHWT